MEGMANKNKILSWMMIGLVKLLFKYPLIWLVLGVLGGGFYAYEVKIARPAQIYKGVPESQGLNAWYRVFRNADFMLGYSDLRGNPLWVAYALSAVDKGAKRYKRPSTFKVDWRSLNQVTHKDYTRSGYDRGHMAPNYAISSLYGRAAQLDSFLMSNISPQSPKLNRKLWQRLEEVGVKHFTQLPGKLWVLTGPVFDEHTQRLSSAWRVEIPDAFYKIYIREIANKPPQTLAFLMPQKVRGNESLNRYVVSIDKIESLTGLNFLSELDDDIEAQVEASSASVGWNLQQVANLRGRY